MREREREAESMFIFPCLFYILSFLVNPLKPSPRLPTSVTTSVYSYDQIYKSFGIWTHFSLLSVTIDTFSPLLLIKAISSTCDLNFFLSSLLRDFISSVIPSLCYSLYVWTYSILTLKKKSKTKILMLSVSIYASNSLIPSQPHFLIDWSTS